jgi:hypothetical protein
LTWLLVEHRPLLEHIWNGVCSNGVAFQQVKPASLSYCPTNQIYSS